MFEEKSKNSKEQKEKCTFKPNAPFKKKTQKDADDPASLCDENDSIESFFLLSESPEIKKFVRVRFLNNIFYMRRVVRTSKNEELEITSTGTINE